MKLKEKVIIITGASSGIGAAIAETLAAEEASLILTSRTMEKLEAAAAELAHTGASIVAVPGDVTVAADCKKVVQAAVDTFGRVDVLINNAGYGPPASLVDTTEQIWDDTIDTCLKSVYLMTRAVIKTMLAQGGGTVVNISSVAGKGGFENRTAYCAAKWGVQGFTESLRAELGGQNIRAHTINPGAVATPWWDTNDDPQSNEIMQRMIQPEEVATAVKYLLEQPARIQIDEIVIKTNGSPWENEGRWPQ